MSTQGCILLILTYSEDIYIFCRLQINQNQQNNLNQGLILNFQQNYNNLFYHVHFNSIIFAPTKVLIYLTLNDSKILQQQLFCLWLIFSLGVDLFFCWMEGLFSLSYLFRTNYPDLANILITNSLSASFNFMACVTVLAECQKIQSFLQFYAKYNIILAFYYYKSIKNRVEYMQLQNALERNLIIKFFFHIDVETKIHLEGVQFLGCITLNQSTKFSLMQKGFLLVSYIYCLMKLDQVTSYQYFCLCLIVMSPILQFFKLVQFMDLRNSKNPYQIEIDNFYDLKKYIQLYEQESQNNKFLYFKNLKLVIIYINPNQYVNHSDLLVSLFLSFGTSEICSRFYSRQLLEQSQFYQKIKLNTEISANGLEITIKNSQILPQIKLLETKVKQNVDFYKIISLLLKNNILLKIENIEQGIQENLNINLIEINNKCFDQTNITHLQALVFNAFISDQQIYNPLIIFYDLYED
ncbi:hypothetical protein ABPG72_022561 [Tetrahymena utriculariae]